MLRVQHYIAQKSQKIVFISAKKDNFYTFELYLKKIFTQQTLGSCIIFQFRWYANVNMPYRFVFFLFKYYNCSVNELRENICRIFAHITHSRVSSFIQFGCRNNKLPKFIFCRKTINKVLNLVNYFVEIKCKLSFRILSGIILNHWKIFN